MRLLVAVKSCEFDRQRGAHQAVRETWGSLLPENATLRFFIGIDPLRFLDAPMTCEEDEIYLACPDDYQSLPYKTKAICEWVGKQDFDYVYLCDTDTFVVPKLLLEAGFEGYDYAGKITRTLGVPFTYVATDREGKKWPIPRCYGWASGGIGYFLSKAAAELVAKEEPTSWAEDLWIGQVAGKYYPNSIKIKDLPYLENRVSFHYPAHNFKKGYDPASRWQYTMFNEVILGVRPKL